MSVEKPDVVASLRSYYERRRHAEFKSLTDCAHRPAHSDVCRKCSRLSGDPIHDMGVERRPVTVPFERALSGDFPLLRHDFTPPPEGVGDPRTCPLCWEGFYVNSSIIDENQIVRDLKDALRDLGHRVVEIDTVKRAIARLEEGGHGD